jgi:hypothetical protein
VLVIGASGPKLVAAATTHYGPSRGGSSAPNFQVCGCLWTQHVGNVLDLEVDGIGWVALVRPEGRRK